MFYDAGLLVVTVLVAVDRGWLSSRAAAVAWALTLGHLAAGELGASPLAILVMAGFAIISVRAFSSSAPLVEEPSQVPA